VYVRTHRRRHAQIEIGYCGKYCEIEDHPACEGAVEGLSVWDSLAPHLLLPISVRLRRLGEAKSLRHAAAVHAEHVSGIKNPRGRGTEVPAV
jgi:hypothetical protein